MTQIDLRVGQYAQAMIEMGVAGWLVADRMGLPWATSATNAAAFTDPFSGTPKIEVQPGRASNGRRGMAFWAKRTWSGAHSWAA